MVLKTGWPKRRPAMFVPNAIIKFLEEQKAVINAKLSLI
jgi:hypothetical protein